MKQEGFEWYAVRVISGQEKKARQYLESEIKRLNLSNFYDQIIIPIERVYEMRQGKKKSREKILYPGYVFAHLYTTLEDGEYKIQPEVLQAMKDTPGIVGFAGNDKGKIPIPLRKNEIEDIQKRMEELEDTGETIETPFSAGENIKVIDGPFSGFSGVIDEVMDEKKKLRVIVKIFGRNTPVELNYLQVERI